MKVGIKLGKVKKFGIGWCIPHRVEVLEAVNAVCVCVGGFLPPIFDVRTNRALPSQRSFLQLEEYMFLLGGNFMPGTEKL